MKKGSMLWTTLIVCIIITIGFIMTYFLSYHNNTILFEKEIEDVTTLSSDGICYQMDSLFTKPLRTALIMANDSFCENFLIQEEELAADPGYTASISEWLRTYKDKNTLDFAYLISESSQNFYNYNGTNQPFTDNTKENQWYFDFLNSPDEYMIDIRENNEDKNSTGFFFNSKIRDTQNNVIGVIGVGLKIAPLQELFKQYRKNYHADVCLIDEAGYIKAASYEVGYNNVFLFKNPIFTNKKDDILSNKTGKEAFWYTLKDVNGFAISQYIPDLKCYLVSVRNTESIRAQLIHQIYKGTPILIFTMLIIAIIVLTLMYYYNKKFVNLSLSQEQEYKRLLHDATNGLYENIYELDVTHNCAGAETTKDFFESLGINRDAPYNQALRKIASEQIKSEYIPGYLDTFDTQNVLKAYNNGITNLSYDFMVVAGKENFHWMRVTARIFYWSSDQSVRMITYRQNIDSEKKHELELLEKSQKDSLTGLYNKRTTEDLISEILKKDQYVSHRHAFFIFDIDNFKTVNDTFGHSFGDSVIIEFASEIKAQFRDSDVVGRIGGDEFIVLMKNFTSIDAIKEKLERLCSKLSHKDFGKGDSYHFSTSIGVSLFPKHGLTYTELYEKADQGLYYSKGHGKGSFCIFGLNASTNSSSHVDQRDISLLLKTSTDGIVKVACMEDDYKLLYFNQSYINLTGFAASHLSSAEFKFLSQIHPADLSKVMEQLKQASAASSPFTLAFHMNRSDGYYFPVNVRGVFVNELYENEYPIFYGIFTDLSDFVKLES